MEFTSEKLQRIVTKDQSCQMQIIFAALYANGKVTINAMHEYINNTLNIPIGIFVEHKKPTNERRKLRKM